MVVTRVSLWEEDINGFVLRDSTIRDNYSDTTRSLSTRTHFLIHINQQEIENGLRLFVQKSRNPLERPLPDGSGCDSVGNLLRILARIGILPNIGKRLSPQGLHSSM